MNPTERVIREQFALWVPVLSQTLPELGPGPVIVTGCGTSYYLAQTIAAAFSRSGRLALAVPGAEWARRSGDYAAFAQGATLIALSRSGTTTETLQALKAGRAAGLATLALCCAAATPILQAAGRGICLPTHPDEGIVMSASASLMLLAGLRLAGVRPPAPEIAAAVMQAIQPLAQVLPERRHFVFLGGGPLYGAASEGALKLQEMSLSFAQTFHPMEYRHGPVSLIDRASLVVLLYSEDTAAEEEVLAGELRAKGAFVLGLGGPGDLSVPLTSLGPARAAEVLPALQLIGELTAQSRRIDSTSPRHLTKVVLL